MVSVVAELKAKLAELEVRLESIGVEALILESQKAAFTSARSPSSPLPLWLLLNNAAVL